jgi:hypothetical protein
VIDVTAQPMSVETRANAHHNDALKLARTCKKIREAEFFLGQLLAEDATVLNQGPEAADFYLSAFLNSACYVNRILRTENPDKYESWFRDWFAHRPADGELMDFFLEQQNTVQKEGSVDAEHTFTTVSLVEFIQYIHGKRANLFKAPGMAGAPLSAFTKANAGFRDDPDDSIGAGCSTYLNLLKQLAAEFEHGAS